MMEKRPNVMPRAVRVPDTFGAVASRALGHLTYHTLPVTCTAHAHGMTCGRHPIPHSDE